MDSVNAVPPPTLLSDLTPGSIATVSRMLGEPSRTQRLREMGLIPGTRIKFMRWAPLGDPLEIELRGYRLSLRRHEAELIEVTPVTPV